MSATTFRFMQTSITLYVMVGCLLGTLDLSSQHPVVIQYLIVFFFIFFFILILIGLFLVSSTYQYLLQLNLNCICVWCVIYALYIDHTI